MTLNKNITILVNSCDSYSDLWIPFFTLLKKYWNTDGVQIILNTETKDFSFDGLDIECVHCKNKPYGERLIHVLQKVKTDYVINVLDDFFLRKPVDNQKVNQILDWMEADKKIAYFSFDPYITEYDLPCPYDGFSQICPGTPYTLTLQMAIWRTKVFKSYWRKSITPWEWELYCNIKTCWNTKDVFIRTKAPQIFDYGYKKFGEWMGVQRGKWVIEDVGPLFEKEGIILDFEKRNAAKETIKLTNPVPAISKYAIVRLWNRYKEIIRLLGIEGVPHRLAFDCHLLVSKLTGSKVNDDFYEYTRKQARERYLKSHHISTRSI